jgi:hypothetical protein
VYTQQFFFFDCLVRPEDYLQLNLRPAPAREFFTHGDITIASEEPNLGLCSALRAFEQGGVFIVPHLL